MLPETLGSTTSLFVVSTIGGAARRTGVGERLSFWALREAEELSPRDFPNRKKVRPSSAQRCFPKREKRVTHQR